MREGPASVGCTLTGDQAQNRTTTNDEHDFTVTHLVVGVTGDLDPLEPLPEDGLADFERKPKRWKSGHT